MGEHLIDQTVGNLSEEEVEKLLREKHLALFAGHAGLCIEITARTRRSILRVLAFGREVYAQSYDSVNVLFTHEPFALSQFTLVEHSPEEERPP